MREDSSIIPSTSSGKALPPPSRRRAFTLVEMLIVIGIIVLLVTIAVPAFRALSGGRSVEASANNLSAILGRARTMAIGQQRVTGVLFVLDPGTERVNCVIVQDSGPPLPPAATNYSPTPGAVFLDLTDPAESILLPVGVSLQVLDDNEIRNDPNHRLSDRYLGFNPVCFRTATNATIATPLTLFSESNGNHTDTGIPAKVSGVIMFDSQGRLVVRPFRLKLSLGLAPTALHKLLRNDDTNFPANQVEGRPGPGAFSGGVVTAESDCYSSIGLALFDYQAFKELHPNPTNPNSMIEFTDDDPQYRGAVIPIAEQHEETWINDNGLLYYVNRYNGSLVRSE